MADDPDTEDARARREGLRRAVELAAAAGGSAGADRRRGLDRVRRALRRRLVRRLLLPALDAAGLRRVSLDLPAFRGRFVLDARGDVAEYLLCGDFETTFAALVPHLILPGDHVVDIGANAGLYTVLCASAAHRGRVLAVEPNPDAQALLRTNLHLNGVRHADVWAGALGDREGTVQLQAVEGHSEFSSVGGIHHPAAPATGARIHTVPCARLDDLLASRGIHPDFIKMDVEGYEGRVLAGAARTLSEHRPVILSEIDDRLLGPAGDSAAGIGALLRRQGYAVFDLTGPCRRLELDEDGAPYVGEVLACPEELLG